MSISKSSGTSELYVNGELVDKKGFITESNAETMNYLINNNNEFISGEIDKSKLDEEDLLNFIRSSEFSKINY